MLARASNPHQLYWVLTDVDELPAHGGVEEHTHEVVQMPFRPRGKIKLLQPQLDCERLQPRHGIVASSRFNLVIEV